MASNPYVNKVVYGNSTVMDISDSTAEEADVKNGEVFYKGNGARSVGTANLDGAVWGNITGTLSNQTDLQTELDNKVITLTKAQYDALSSAQKNDPSKVYYVTDYDPISSEEANEIWEANGILGAKNLLPNNGITTTVSGVTFTVNNDGSITVSGTATADIYYLVSRDYYLSEGGYILSGCPAGGSVSNSYCLYIYNRVNGSSTTTIAWDIGNSSSFNFSERKQYGVSIYIKSGTTISKTFTPMIRLASDTDATYRPYAMTNRELTKKEPLTLSVPSTASSYVEIQNSHSFRVGNVCCVRTQIHVTTAMPHNTMFLKADARHRHYGVTVMCDTNGSSIFNIFVNNESDNNPTIQFSSRSGNGITIPAGWYAITYTWIED